MPLNDNWRIPTYHPPTRYVRRPPLGNTIEEFAFILMRYNHGVRDYEPCDHCTQMARSILPETATLFAIDLDQLQEKRLKAVR